MESNIFNDPGKQMLNQSMRGAITEREEKKVEDQPKKYPATPKIRTRTTANFDWKSTNSELLFRKGRDKVIDAKTKKMNDFKSSLDPEHVVNFVHTDEKAKFEVKMGEKIDSEILDKMKQNCSTNDKFSRTFHNLSTMHDKDFYKNSLGKTNPNKTIQAFIVENIIYDSFNMKEFKSLFNQNGIHIYDINMQGNYGQGNSKGVLTYKIRRNEDIEGFNDKLNTINERIYSDFKSKVKSQVQSTKRPMTENIPSNVKWSNTQMKSYTKNRKIDQTNQEDKKVKLNVSERFASNKNHVDYAYKNSMSKRHFEKGIKK